MKKTIITMAILLLVLVGCNTNEKSSDDTDTDTEDVITLKYSLVQSMDSPTGEAAELLKEKLQEKSDGKIDLEIYADGQLFDDSTEQDALLSENIDLISPWLGKTTELDSSLQYSTFPFLFEDIDQMMGFYNSDKADIVYEKLENKGFKVVGAYAAGEQTFMGKGKPIKVPDDLNGLKVRDAGGGVSKAVYDEVGASLTNVSFNELYTALQTGTVDTAVTAIGSAADSQFGEVIDYVTVTDHVLSPYILLMNKEKFDNYSDDVKNIVLDSIQETRDLQLEKTKEENEVKLEILGEQAEVIELSNEEKDAFRQRWEPLRSEFSDVLDPKVFDAIKEYKEDE